MKRAMKNREAGTTLARASLLGNNKNRKRKPLKSVNKTYKIGSEQTSYCASKAAALLGISIPTLKGLCNSGQLTSFRTPGGHLRVSAESVRDVGHDHQLVSSRSGAPLAIRRERVEEKKLQIEELRLTNEEERIRAELEAKQTQSRNERRIAEIKRQAKAEERRREREAQQARLEQQRQEVEERSLRAKLLTEAEDLLPSWLSHEEHEQCIDDLKGLVDTFGVDDFERTRKRLRDAVTRFTEESKLERQIAERRERILQSTMWRLHRGATPSEKTTAAHLIREALDLLPLSRTEVEEQAVAENAVSELDQEIKQRWETAEACRRSEADAKAKKDAEAFAKWKDDFDRQQQGKKIDDRVRQGMTMASLYLLRCQEEPADDEEDYETIEVDDDAALLAAVERGLRDKITGDETYDQVSKISQEIVDSELGG